MSFAIDVPNGGTYAHVIVLSPHLKTTIPVAGAVSFTANPILATITAVEPIWLASLE